MNTTQLIEFLGNHPYLAMALVAVLVMIVLNEVRTFSAASFQLTPANAVLKFNREGAQFLDLRPISEFEKSRIPNAMSIPVGELEASLQSLHAFKEQGSIILYSQAGLEMSSPRKLLMRHGFDSVFELQGGFDAWREHHFPVETSKKRSKK